MTEHEWLNCTDLRPMLEVVRGKCSDRLLRLFAVGCCRCNWYRLSPHARMAVQMGERLAEGHSVFTASAQVGEWGVSSDADVVAFATATRGAAEAADVAAAYAAEAVRKAEEMAEILINYTWHVPGTCCWHTDLFRCILGPFRPVAPEAVSLTWNDGTIPKIAQAIYDERSFDHLPILADALEDAGCHNADVLTHCRRGGKHDRGCWVIDLLLGKK